MEEVKPQMLQFSSSSAARTLSGEKRDTETLGLVLEGGEYGGTQGKDQIILVIKNK